MSGEDDGFTLVELMVVIAIVAILSSFAIPPFLEWRANTRFMETMSGFTSNILRAKVTAIRENRDVDLRFVNQAEYQILMSDSKELVKTVFMPKGVLFDLNPSQTTFPDKTITFNGRGYPDNLPSAKAYCLVTIVNDLSRKAVVSLNRTGQIKVN